MNQELFKLENSVKKAEGAWDRQMKRDGHLKKESRDISSANPSKMSETARAFYNEFTVVYDQLKAESHKSDLFGNTPSDVKGPAPMEPPKGFPEDPPSPPATGKKKKGLAGEFKSKKSIPLGVSDRANGKDFADIGDIRYFMTVAEIGKGEGYNYDIQAHDGTAYVPKISQDVLTLEEAWSACDQYIASERGEEAPPASHLKLEAGEGKGDENSEDTFEFDGITVAVRWESGDMKITKFVFKWGEGKIHVKSIATNKVKISALPSFLAFAQAEFETFYGTMKASEK